LSEEFELYALGFYGLPFLFPPCLSQGFVLSWVFAPEFLVCFELRLEGAEFGFDCGFHWASFQTNRYQIGVNVRLQTIAMRYSHAMI
jgi:hypothetical protein